MTNEHNERGAACKALGDGESQLAAIGRSVVRKHGRQAQNPGRPVSLCAEE